MNTILLYRLGGFALVLTGITLWIDAALETLYPNMAFGLCFLVSTLGLFGLTAVFFYQIDKSRALGVAAYALSTVGLGGILGVAINNNIFSLVVDPEKLNMMMNGSSHVFFISFGIIFILGSILMSATVWQAGRFPKFTAPLYLVGALPLAIPTLAPHALVIGGAVLVGVAVTMWGLRLLFNKEELVREVVV